MSMTEGNPFRLGRRNQVEDALDGGFQFEHGRNFEEWEGKVELR